MNNLPEVDIQKNIFFHGRALLRLIKIIAMYAALRQSLFRIPEQAPEPLQIPEAGINPSASIALPVFSTNVPDHKYLSRIIHHLLVFQDGPFC